MRKIQEYIIEIFGADENTSATIIVTIIVFFIGFLINYLVNVAKAYHRRKNRRKVFIQAMKDLSKHVLHQSKAYMDTANLFSFEKDRNFELYRVELFQLKVLKQIGYSDTFNAFINGFENFKLCSKSRNYRIKAFNKIWKVIHSLEFWQEKSFSDIGKFIETYNNYNDLRNESVEKHRKLVGSILFKTISNPLPANLAVYIKSIDNINVSWQNSENRTNPCVLHKKLVIPLRILNRQYRHFDIANVMNENLIDATHHLTNMDNLLKTYKKQYLVYERLFRNSDRIIKKSLKIINDNC